MTNTLCSRLLGYSGCVLEVHRQDSRTWVRKRSPDLTFNAKFQWEIRKIERLNGLGAESKLFAAPEIISTGTEDEIAFYDMEYVVGQTLEFRIDSMDAKELRSTARLLNEIHAFFASQTPLENPPAELSEWRYLVSKLEETLSFLEGNAVPLPAESGLVSTYRERLEELSGRSFDWRSKPTFCHGDLALDNVLVTRQGRIYLLDPLFNAFETVAWDRAKVLQSSLLQWDKIKRGEIRVDPKEGKIISGGSGKMQIFNLAYIGTDGQGIEPSRLLLYLGVTMARIVKYAKDRGQAETLLALVNQLLGRYLRGGA